MAKRRFISLLPADYQSTDLTNFFGSTVDQLFQPGISQPISGYVGRKPSFYDSVTDFYINEPTTTRVAYQLESGMISSTDSTITNTLTYPDFINHLNISGANVTDQERMFENEYYSWAPPINIDMLVNYRNYMWFGDSSGDVELPTLTLTVPMNYYTGNSIQTTFALPNHIISVTSGEETPAVYVDNIPVSFSIVGNNVICDVAPATSSIVLVTRIPDLAAVLTGKITIDVSDINTNNVQYLTSTMRIKIIDSKVITGAWDAQPWDEFNWDSGGSGIFMVDGVGQSIRFTPDESINRDIVLPQYVTIDRSSYDTNLWSYHNCWVHKDSYKWSGLSFPERTATRPIIEFIRDIVLYPNQIWSESSYPKFMLYDIENRPLNDVGYYPKSDFDGNRIFVYSTGSSPIDTVLKQTMSYDNNGYPLFNNEAYSIQYNNNGSPITSLYCYGTYDDNSLSSITCSSLWHKTDGVTGQSFSNGFYNVPLNLQANPSSEDVINISRSTWLEHFKTILERQVNFSGNPLNDNNYRDSLRDLKLGNSIIQHRCPLLKTMLLSSDDKIDLISSIRYSEQEYNKFRNKFIVKIIDIDRTGKLQHIDPTVSPDVWVVTALKELVKNKNNKFPFSLSNMAGGKYFIPPTPAYFGVLPPTIPSMITDSTYASPILMIQGHDGSLTPSFGDWRDNVLLALETRIYDNLQTQFKTEARPLFDIKSWIGNKFMMNSFSYSFAEVREILNPMFQIWVQSNRLDYRTNTDFDENNPFTWNYNGVKDIFNNTLPGNWRAIYRFYYGTDSPHTRPWEMLGFDTQPSWWVSVYGNTPYLRSNTALWSDLETGTIVSGPRAGVDILYSRPGLIDLIPVDNSGNLLNPIEIGIVNSDVPIVAASRSWKEGDHGPVENMWINSPAYRYDLSIASYLMKPARFVEECWDSVNVGYINEQWVDFNTLYRPLNSTQYVHGETKPNGITSDIIGIQQWISDYLASSGIEPSGFGSMVRGLDVRLLHPMAGFISSDEIQVVADNFGLVPSENIHVMLYTAPATRVEVYSGVILEWTGRSWRAIGYDARNPYFTIIPPNTNGPKGIISLASASEPSIVPWRPNTYYPVGILVSYLNSVYQSLKPNTSGPIFEDIFWTPRSDLSTSMIRSPRVVTYNKGLRDTISIPYGTEFTTYQEIADFLLGWERYLVSKGWVFDNTNSDGQILNWSLSVKEFLTWAQVQWKPGNFIALSPGIQGIKFSTDNGTILNVEDNITGFFGLLDRSGLPINERNVNIQRLDGQISIVPDNVDIYATRLEITTIEHLLIVDNTTVFDDTIYLPLFNLRQNRLRLICNRSPDWSGRLDAPGFVIIGDKLKSNFEKSATDVALMFDIELSDNKTLRDYARHNIGFQKRTYLNNLLLSDIEQFEFYQGMIQQKGTPGVFEKLMRSQRASSNSNLHFLEEWAFRTSTFGSPSESFVTFQLTQLDTRTDPQIIRFVSTPNSPLTWINMPLSDNKWYDKPNSYNFFPQKTNNTESFPTAGPVRLSDVDYTVFRFGDLDTKYNELISNSKIPFATGTKTWIYEKNDRTYTVLESFDTGRTGIPFLMGSSKFGDNLLTNDISPNKISKIITKSEDSSVKHTRILFQNKMTLTSGDVGNYLVIDGSTNSNPELQGTRLIVAVNVIENYVDINDVSNSGHDFTGDINSPIVRVLREIRFQTETQLFSSTNAFNINDKVWIDNYMSTYKWAVMQWNGSTWNVIRNQPIQIDSTIISETVLYKENVAITSGQMIVHEPLIESINIVDPLSGLIAGVCKKEIDFYTPYDPARYNSGDTIVSNNTWGEEQVGRVWWDISTVKFLEPYTDTVGITNTRDIDELTYRKSVWARIAPSTSVDVYEWVKSSVSPQNYKGPGILKSVTDSSPGITVFAGQWVETSKADPITGLISTFYYFWVKGLTDKPNVSFRNMDITSVANGITNPANLDIAWLSPIETNTMLVSGVIQYLNDIDSVLKIKLTPDENDQGKHSEWKLMRVTDETSLPTDIHWNHLRNSLAGFNSSLQTIPNPSLSITRNTGMYEGQNMFIIDGVDGPRTELMKARKMFVQSINNIFAKNPIAIERQIYIPTIERNSIINQNLIWTQFDISYPYEAPPKNEYSIRVTGIEQRNRLLGTSIDFLNAVTTSTPIYVLVDKIGNSIPRQSWSIWKFNPVKASNIIALNPYLTPSVAMMQNAEQIFDLALSYEYSVASMVYRNSLIPTLNVGDRVLVETDVSGFWTIYKYLPYDSKADNFGFVLWRAQTYRTSDFISNVDWYDIGYSALNPPVISYGTISERNADTTLANTFVKINDDGTGKWIWTVLTKVSNTNNIPELDLISNQYTTVWKIVARQNGTIALSNNFYDSTKTIYGVNSINLDSIDNRDGSWELYILLEALRHGGMLLPSEINSLWFDVVNFCHVQQNDVDWAFKTSFMNVIGYNVPLQASPFIIKDQTSDLLTYINEVKPYRVKVREFSTQYSPDIDTANVSVTDFDNPVYFDASLNKYRTLDPIYDVSIMQTLPWSNWYNNYNVSTNSYYNPNLVRGFNITLKFDRFVSDVFGWDEHDWDSGVWDDDGDIEVNNYVHTTINQELTTSGPTISVDNIKGMRPFGFAYPITINLNGNTYEIGSIVPDATNISTTTHGISGKLTTVSGNINAVDATLDMLVEAVIVIKTASEMILEYYNPTGDMPEKKLALLMNLEKPSSKIYYSTTTTEILGSSNLTMTDVTSLHINQQVFGPYIIDGTIITDIVGNNVTLSKAILGTIPSGTTITFTLPNNIDGNHVSDLTSPSDFDTIGFDTVGFDTTVVDYVDSAIDGSSLDTPTIELNINPSDVSKSRPDGYGLRDPYYSADHPEEKLPLVVDDGIQITVTANSLSGGPSQTIKEFDVSGLTTATLFFDMIAQASSSIMVFRDGVRAIQNIDYIVNYFDRKIDVDTTGVTFVQIHAFGFGGDSIITEKSFVDFSSNPIVLDSVTTLSNVAVIQDGVLLDSSLYSVSGANVTITAPPSIGTEIAIIVYESGTSTATTMNTEVLSWNAPQIWTLTYNDTHTVPEHAGTIVEIDGLRLAPLTTFYGSFSPSNPWMYLPIYPDISTTITVYVDGVLYTAAIPFCTSTDVLTSTYPFYIDGTTFTLPPTNIDGQFVFFDHLLVALDPTFTGEVSIVMDFVGSPPDYTVNSGVLTINSSINPASRITVTTFTNAQSMGLKTVVYDNDGTVSEYIVPKPFAKDYMIVNMNGKAIAPEFDYNLEGVVGWDAIPWDSAPWDVSYDDSIIKILNPVAGKFIVTSTTLPAAREEISWKVVNSGPSFNRMKQIGLNDMNVPIFDIDFDYSRQSPYMAGMLSEILHPTDTTISLNLFLKELSTKLQNPYPLTLPTKTTPGAIWIGNERIEYYKYDRIGDAVILTGLRRGTHGTSIVEQRIVSTGIGTGSLQTFILDASNGIGPVEVSINGEQTDSFTYSVIGSNMEVVLSTTIGNFVTVAMTIGNDYSIGTKLYNADEEIYSAIPIGINAGNIEISPIKTIIAN